MWGADQVGRVDAGWGIPIAKHHTEMTISPRNRTSWDFCSVVGKWDATSRNGTPQNGDATNDPWHDFQPYFEYNPSNPKRVMTLQSRNIHPLNFCSSPFFVYGGTCPAVEKNHPGRLHRQVRRALRPGYWICRGDAGGYRSRGQHVTGHFERQTRGDWSF